MTRTLILAVTAITIAACSRPVPETSTGPQAAPPEYYGTLEPFAADAVYFVLTDRFVDGDAGNNQLGQGGAAHKTFDLPIQNDDGQSGNIGYLGGDFAGLLKNADYIADMGFGAVWITPIVDNPDESFSGGYGLGEAMFADRGKAGYHGYWGVNFFAVDEHLESADVTFEQLVAGLRDRHGLKTVLDIVCNHGSPSYTMPKDQPKFGELYDRDGTLVADHQNLQPQELDDANPLHDFFHREPDLAELSNLDDTNPAVLDYFVRAYLQWLDQGVAALRIDTIRHMPHAYWKGFSEALRKEHPGLFMFGESFDYNAEKIAEHTWPENGGVSVLDFPGRQRITEVFAGGMDYSTISDYLHLDDGIYQNAYELMTFYDNHDMPRMAAEDDGFIDAHNWLFTSRGIPVIYYGSEIGFRAGRPEHGGNRDYFGQDNLEIGKTHRIRGALTAIAEVRATSPALQRGLQVNLDFTADTAAFLRVFQHAGQAQSALVLLNKGGGPATVTAGRWLSSGEWVDAMTGESTNVEAGALAMTVPAHGVRVMLFDGPNNNEALAVELQRLHEARLRQPPPAS